MNGRSACQVGFVKTDCDRTRVFLDAALVERGASKDWTLLRRRLSPTAVPAGEPAWSLFASNLQ
jgi:hypothetical protein